MPIDRNVKTIAELIRQTFERFREQDRPVLMKKKAGSYEGISYSRLEEQVHTLAQGLATYGVGPASKIAIISENRPEWVIADMALVLLGAVSVPMYPTLTPRQVAYILQDAGVECVIVSNQLQFSKVQKIRNETPSIRVVISMAETDSGATDAVRFADVMSRGSAQRAGASPDNSGSPRPEDLLTIIYTSGTTGNPKGVMLTHANMVSNILSSSQCIPITPDDTLLSFLPLCHSFERMAGYYTAFACGATIAYAESIDTVRDNLLEVRPTIVTTVPRLFERMYNRIMKQLEDAPPIRKKIFDWAVGVGRRYADARRQGPLGLVLRLQHSLAQKLVFSKIRERTGGRLRFFVSGGAALSEELGKFFEAVGILIIEGYGMTETSPVITVNRLDDYRFGSVGKPIPGVEVKIASDGEILTRGPNVMRGYWNDPAATKEILNDEGWLHTGDIGRFDGEGFLKITDRKKHLFVNSGGKNIAPQHIEGLFLQNRYIDQFVLIGDKQPFCTALIVPDFESLKDVARREGISFASHKDLSANPAVAALYQKEIDTIQRDLAGYERVRRFTLLSEPLTVERGELTPTQKVKRKAVEEIYKSDIEAMYKSVPSS